MSIEEYRTRIKAEKRGAALDAAIASFLEHGYAGTTLIEVAKAAGISTGTLFKHFPTKAALFEGILEHLWQSDETAREALPPAGDPAAGLVAIGRAHAARLLDPRTIALFRVIIAEAVRFPDLGRALHDGSSAHPAERLAEYLEVETALGTLAADDPLLAARQFLGTLGDMLLWPRLLAPDLAVGASEVEQTVREAAETLLARWGRSGAKPKPRQPERKPYKKAEAEPDLFG